MSEPRGEYSLDELAKGLATGTLSRGKAIRWMGGALLGAALASVPGVAWADDCRRLGRACRRDSQCCSRNCIRRGEEKVCACPEGQDRCNDRCVNLERNERHCGACFNRCPEGQECIDGVCGGGTCPRPPLTEGDCNCAFHCGDSFPSPATCQDNPNCMCWETTEGTGFCGGIGNCFEFVCSSSSECPSGWRCVVNTCCVNSPTICLPPCTPVTSSVG
jgi:hypothetical protein